MGKSGAEGPGSGGDDAGDSIIRAFAAGGTVRVVAVVSTELVAEVAHRHGARGLSTIAMGRAASAGLLLATLTKGDERVTLQILGSGPLGAITVDASAAGTARVFAGRHRAVVGALTRGATGDRADVSAAVGTTGLVSVVRDLDGANRFSGQTPMVDGQIDTDVERYLTHSEQIDSALGCETLLDEAGGILTSVGILVQTLPGSEGAAVVAATRNRLRAGVLGEWIRRRLGTGTGDGPLSRHVTPDDVIFAALDEDAASLAVLDRRPVLFFCPCSRDRAAATLALLGESDLIEMIRDEGRAQVTCEFCRADYDFTDVNLEEIRRALRREAVAPS